jgi:CubicO group peptidase (beta-lactamase class C family)
MPAVGVSVFTRDSVLASGAWGAADLSIDEPVTVDHLWDLASLTKGLVTLPEVLSLVDEGVLVLHTPLADQWGRAAGSDLGRATLAQVLSYDAGMPASAPFYLLDVASRSERIEAVIGTSADRDPGAGAVYSDIGAIALGELVAEIRGRSLAELAAARNGLVFNPDGRTAVATERCAWRRRLVKAEVHDENAASLGGVAGHAGAFGTLQQVAAAASDWLRGSAVSPELGDEATREHSRGSDGERFGLGWWLANTRGLGGPSPGEGSWGLSGFVGNRLWMEPTRGYGVLVLSNRIHPERGDRGPYNAWCDELLQLVANALASSA